MREPPSPGSGSLPTGRLAAKTVSITVKAVWIATGYSDGLELVGNLVAVEISPNGQARPVAGAQAALVDGAEPAEGRADACPMSASSVTATASSTSFIDCLE